MKCIYCQEHMVFNGINNNFVSPSCGAKLTLVQHPSLKTIEQVRDFKLRNSEGIDKDTYNNQGIAMQWYRGSK